MARRSGRHSKSVIPTAPLKHLVGSESEGELEPTATTSEDEYVPTGKRKRKKCQSKKRKNFVDKLDGQPVNKKVRGKRGMLKQLPGMPVDVLFEIFGFLEPIDLLHLLWTSKDLRTLLSSRSTTSVWKAARSNVPGLPECPEDLSEPQYANLAFGKTCHFCLKRTTNLHTFWIGRVRTCTRCLYSRFEGPLPWFKRMNENREIQSLLPKITITTSGLRASSTEYSYTEMKHRWQAGYDEAEDKQKWTEDKIRELEPMKAHSDACMTWTHDLKAQLEERKKETEHRRHEIILNHVRGMGWGEEIAWLDRYDTSLKLSFAVQEACKKEVTERVLLDLEPHLNRWMEKVRRAISRTERSILLEERVPILQGALDTYRSTLPLNSLCPDIGDIFFNPVVMDLITTAPKDDSEATHFERLSAVLPDVSRQVLSEIEDKLIALMLNGREDAHILDRNTVFNLATTTFNCLRCLFLYGTPIRYPRVVVHHCATRYPQISSTRDLDTRVLTEVTLATIWNHANRISFDKYSSTVLSDVVALCGFDPKTTTAAEMDAADPILECLACNSIYEGRLTMRWSLVPAHIRDIHNQKNSLNLEVLGDREAKIVRSRLDEMEARIRADSHHRDMVCFHCRETGCTGLLRQHAQLKHGVLNPTDQDIVPKLDSNCVRKIFRLWPPRMETQPEIGASLTA